MQTFEIPDKDNDLHIVIKRPKEPNLENFVTREMFVEFTSAMNQTMQKILHRIGGLEVLLQTLTNQELMHGGYEVEDELEKPEDEEEEQQYIKVQEESNLDMDDFAEFEENAEIVVHEIEAASPVKRRRTIQSPPVVKKFKVEAIDDDQKVQFVEVENAREETVETIADDFSEVGQDVVVEGESDFSGIQIPIRSVSDLKALNQILVADDYLKGKFREKMRELTVKSENNFQKALSFLLMDNVLFELNWQGFKGKTKMADMILFGRLIYEEWFTHIDYDEYITQLKIITKKAHKRYAKTQERKRQRENRIISIDDKDQIHSALEAIIHKEHSRSKH